MQLPATSPTAGQGSREQINISQSVTYAFKDRIRPVEINKSFIIDFVKKISSPYLEYK